jgi:hypothetical protein
MFLIARVGLFVLSAAFSLAGLQYVGVLFLGLGIMGMGMDSKGIERVSIIASGAIVIAITLNILLR